MPAIEFKGQIKKFNMLTPTVFELFFEPSVDFEFKAGQFVSIVIPGAGPGGRDLRRAYSIASAPHVRPIELCVKLVEGGPGTNYLYKLREGDQFRAFAPYGDFLLEPVEGNGHCFISTGTGIAPFRSMIFSEQFKGLNPPHAMCLLGVREENEILYDQEMKQVRGLKWQTLVSRPTGPLATGQKGRVTDYLRALGSDYPWTNTQFYLCGAGAMIDEVKQILAEKGVVKDHIHQEVYYKTPAATS